uniref:RNase H domain-containing protein n=1 Tax=Macrostomum lignano TaxID=282301 RepID=A0A1I8FXL4_9PLAT
LRREVAGTPRRTSSSREGGDVPAGPNPSGQGRLETDPPAQAAGCSRALGQSDAEDPMDGGQRAANAAYCLPANRGPFAEEEPMDTGDPDPKPINTQHCVAASVNLMRTAEQQLPGLVFAQEPWMTKGKKSAPWWNPELGALRRRARTLQRRALKTKDPSDREAYTRAIHEFKGQVRRAKTAKWRQYCEGLEGSRPVARVVKALTNDRFSKLSVVKRPDGSVTGSSEETLELMLNSFFPKSPTQQGPPDHTGFLGRAERWANQCGLRLSESKTTAVMFTNKLLWTIKPLTLYGKNISMEKQVRCLGLTLDHRLNWTPHIQTKAKKALAVLAQIRRAVGTTWGLTPRKLWWIYTAIIRPSISYASLVWASGLSVKREAAKSTRRLLDAGVAFKKVRAFKKRSLIPHSDLCLKALEECGGLNILSDSIPATLLLSQRYKVTIQPRHEASDSWSDSEVHCYTDGSMKHGLSGFGACVFFKGEVAWSYSQHTGLNSSVFQSEVLAISSCAAELRRRQLSGRKLIFHSDSQAALRALCRCTTSSRSVLDCNTQLNGLALGNQVELRWIPGHAGFLGNERADLLAKAGSAGALLGPGPGAPIPASVINSRVKRWADSEHLRRARYPRSGAPSAAQAVKTPSHFICHCPVFTRARLTHLGPNPVLSDVCRPESIPLLARYLRDMGRADFFPTAGEEDRAAGETDGSTSFLRPLFENLFKYSLSLSLSIEYSDFDTSECRSASSACSQTTLMCLQHQVGILVSASGQPHACSILSSSTPQSRHEPSSCRPKVGRVSIIGLNVKADQGLSSRQSGLSVMAKVKNSGKSADLVFLCSSFRRCKHLRNELVSNPSNIGQALQFEALGRVGSIPVRFGFRSSANLPRLRCNRHRWIVFQRRVDGSLSFAQNWDSYVKGFGNPSSNYWMGLDRLSEMTKTAEKNGSPLTSRCRLRIEVQSFRGGRYRAEFRMFQVLGPEQQYRLRVGLQVGRSVLGNQFQWHNDMRFSTFDRDHDTYNYSCSRRFGYGGWWYGGCHRVNLNGAYTTDTKITRNPTYMSFYVHGKHVPMRRSLMKFSSAGCCPETAENQPARAPRRIDKLDSDLGDLCIQAGDLCLQAGNLCLQAGDLCLQAGDLCLQAAGNLCIQAGDLCIQAGRFLHSSWAISAFKLAISAFKLVISAFKLVISAFKLVISAFKPAISAALKRKRFRIAYKTLKICYISTEQRGSSPSRRPSTVY